MNRHILADQLIGAIAKLYPDRNKFFSESIESVPVFERIDQLSIQLERQPVAGSKYRVPVKTPEGNVFQASFDILQWSGFDAPTLIFHHGSGDIPTESRLNKIFPPSFRPRALNLIAVGALFHHSKQEYLKAVRSLSHFASIFSAGALLTELWVENLRDHGSENIVVSGMSLGGWITNLHRSRFHSADLYLPIMAGAAMDHLFTDTIYSNLTSKKGKQNRQRIHQVLNFESEFLSVTKDDVAPLLAQYDQFIQFERHRFLYPKDRITSDHSGHVTLGLKNEALRNYLIKNMNEKLDITLR